ncbi:MAG: nucleotidyl transferase AbiEii/AbiGii toxin family protein [bacterium]|nr:nucleotidyl transferase AbiEii/AbiGii toxin family protein [bacterium]
MGAGAALGGVELIFPRYELERVAAEFGFHTAQVEQAVRLLDLLNAVGAHPELGDKLVLKGGTALNLFLFAAPRLSVDLDFNYIGAADPDIMRADRGPLEEALGDVCRSAGYEVTQLKPGEHAGDKWELRYQNTLGSDDKIEIDLNYMHRVPLWPPRRRDSYPLGRWRATDVQVVDDHELAAGKLHALGERAKARDLFDAALIPSIHGLDEAKVRTAFVVHGAVSNKDWRKATAIVRNPPPGDLQANLWPMLPADSSLHQLSPGHCLELLKAGAAPTLSAVLPLTELERRFQDGVKGHGLIDATLLTSDQALQARIAAQPGLAWQVFKVQQRRKSIERRRRPSSGLGLDL